MDVMPLLLLVAGSAAVAGAARRTPVPAPLLLVAAGLAVSFVPGIPDYTLDPDVVLPLLLPRCCTPRPSTAPTWTCAPRCAPWPCCPSDTCCSRPWWSAGSPT
ncbi:hypothetical protein GCM10010512_37360 [Streptomyces thermoviolaceus subsp. thermoviolaceus]|nr:hypothetical protein GCM10010512_37360 [Streptomyces thermoviolaceus subsp. thermoviolaceus]